MKDLAILKSEVTEAFNKCALALEKINSEVQFKGYEDYKITTHTSWNELRFIIAHKEFNWSDFLTVTLSDDKGFDFSHGSGGFHNSTATQRLNATKDMFNIVSLLDINSVGLLIKRKELAKLEEVASKLREELTAMELELALANAKEKLLKTHKTITPKEIIDALTNDLESIDITYIASHYKHGTELINYTVENRGINKINFYFYGSRYSKADLISILERNEYFVKI